MVVVCQYAMNIDMQDSSARVHPDQTDPDVLVETHVHEEQAAENVETETESVKPSVSGNRHGSRRAVTKYWRRVTRARKLGILWFSMLC
jgi:hypothetical protein